MYRLFTAAVVGVLTVAAASMLMAQETEPQTDRMHKGMQMMKAMDADGNGEISREEFVQAHEKMFDSMDENGDGTLDQEEQAAMMQKMRQRKMEHMGDHERMGDMDHHEQMEKPDASEHD
jgi:hypothetical protein